MSTATSERNDRFADLEKETKELNEINVVSVLMDRYGAEKSGPEVTANVKKLGARVRQQKFKVTDGHYINVTEGGAWWDLLAAQGGAGAISMVKHMEPCEFQAARTLLKEWYPNAAQFAGPKIKFDPRALVEPEPEHPVVLPKFSRSSHADPKMRKDYNHVVERYLTRERGLPKVLVRKAMDANLFYPVEKTLVELIKGPGSEQMAAEMEKICKEKKYQYTLKTAKFDETTRKETPLVTKIDGKPTPIIRFRVETRPEIHRMLEHPPVYKLAGSNEEYRPQIHSVRVQPELAHPVLKFFTCDPIATSIRSLNGSFKQCVGPKTQGAFMWGGLGPQTKKLVVTESGIEVLSYVALKKIKSDTSVWGLSGSGNIDPVLAYLKENNITIVNAFNNEGAGRKFAERMTLKAKEHGINVEDDLPQGGEVSIEADNDKENQKYFERIREAARSHKLRFLERDVEGKDGKSTRLRMRIESHASVWKLLDLNDPAAKRKAREAQKAGKETEGLVHFRETAEVTAICKDYNDVLRGDDRRIFTTDFNRAFDRDHEYMQPADKPKDLAKALGDAKTPTISQAEESPGVEGPEM